MKPIIIAGYSFNQNDLVYVGVPVDSKERHDIRLCKEYEGRLKSLKDGQISIVDGIEYVVSQNIMGLWRTRTPMSLFELVRFPVDDVAYAHHVQ
ncbi:hypothetical protein J4219_00695 [Candidatus Woesearchaeota archaeon]|nr:hypothetical protein [Candidatus Woesearchaeota archaeon]